MLHDSSQEDPEVIRMSQWAEIRQMPVVDGVPQKQIAGLDGVDDRDAHLSAARNHIAIGDWNIHLGDEPCGLGEHLVNPLPPMEEETKK